MEYVEYNDIVYAEDYGTTVMLTLRNGSTVSMDKRMYNHMIQDMVEWYKKPQNQ